MPNNAAFGMRPTLIVGGVTFTDLANLIILKAICIATTGYHCTFRKAGVAYTPSGAKSFKAWAFGISQSSATQASQPVLLQSDNDVGYGSTTAFTNPVYESGASTEPTLSLAGAYNTNQISEAQKAVFFTIANGKFLSVTNIATANESTYTVYGYEQ